VQQAYEGNLSAPVCERCGEADVRAILALPVTVSGSYILLLLSLLAISVPFDAKTVTTIAFFGGMASLYLGNRGTTWSFEETFYGRFLLRHARVHCWPLQLALAGVMAVLFLVSISEVVVRIYTRGEPEGNAISPRAR
jgi:hypothetical protein